MSIYHIRISIFIQHSKKKTNTTIGNTDPAFYDKEFYEEEKQMTNQLKTTQPH